jgi:hypothetical protein
MVQKVLQLVEGCREKGFRLRTGLTFGFKLADQLQPGGNEFLDAAMGRLKEIGKREEAK